MCPSAIKQKSSELLSDYLGNEVSVKGFLTASGGCINNGGKLSTSSGDFFVKWNDAEKYPGMFDAEQKGLQLLRAQDVIRAPAPIATGQADGKSLILMEYISSGGRGPRYWEHLGGQLAALHRITQDHFGLDHDNYIGSLPQCNSLYKEWTDFFVINRLEAQLRLAIDNREASPEHIRRFDMLFAKLRDYFPEERPALIHGDLWSGNLMTDEHGAPCIIDPAVYYGHREKELAFTQLFGGYDRQFYETYHDVFPLEPGFEDRVDLYNLYPLLVHANLFGGGYMGQVVGILKRFS